MSYLGPNRFPFMQKPADLDERNELDARLPFPPVRFALTCHLDQFEAEGYGRRDIYKLFAWKDGKITIDDPGEQLRLNRLALLVIRRASRAKLVIPQAA